MREAGIQVALTSFRSEDGSRVLATFRAVVEVIRCDSDMVVLPDPDLFVIGSLAARLWGKKPIVDIHEDYEKVAMAREWVPRGFRRVLGLIARCMMFLGRHAAWRSVVAAKELAQPGDVPILNVPNPSDFSPSPEISKRLVYVGDVTVARGALEMIDVLTGLDSTIELMIIGPIDPSTRESVMEKASREGVAGRVHLMGRRPHSEAWSLATGALAGLSLLRPVPAYEMAVPTKLWEYLAAGIPPIVSNSPGQAALATLVSPELVCRTPEEASRVAIRLTRDASFREDAVSAGLRLVTDEWNRARPDLAIQAVVTP